MSNNDEIGDKSDMTRLEDLSEFLHQDDPEVNAALDSDDSPPSLDELPGLEDLEEEQEDQFSSYESTSPDQDDQDQSDLSNSSYDFNSQENDDEDLDHDNLFSDEEDDDEQSFSSSDDSEDESNTFFDQNDEEDNFLTQEEDQEEEVDFLMGDDDQEEDNNFLTEDDDQEDDNDFSTEDNDQGEDNKFLTEDDDTPSSTDADNHDDFILNDTPDLDTEREQAIFNSAQSSEKETPPTITKQTYIDRSEKFEDVKSFAKNITYGKIANGGNPPFSVILRNIKFEEDVEDIMIILNEHELISTDSESAMRQSLEGGSLLISQISEFAAIYLTHKFRRFDLDVQMGLSDELHPSKSYEADSVGLISKSRINQNKNETMRIDKSKVELDAIIIATTPTLENYKIVEYLGIVSDFIIISEDELTEDNHLSESHQRAAKGHVDHKNEEQDEEIKLKISQSAIYNDLSERLKPIGLRKNANAIVGINYQITPLSDGSNYKISCSGSAVWVIDNN